VRGGKPVSRVRKGKKVEGGRMRKGEGG